MFPAWQSLYNDDLDSLRYLVISSMVNDGVLRLGHTQLLVARDNSHPLRLERILEIITATARCCQALTMANNHSNANGEGRQVRALEGLLKGQVEPVPHAEVVDSPCFHRWPWGGCRC